ncbi:DDE-type integrase/transposase/recombinase [Streptomyces sp. NBC_00322]|uniref:DDE-type integrase/transposase/recombinase n=1 Tax=Streptomyces sp. NBC_00322 TaxID=2975712 RepID=UPI003FA691BA
MHHRAPDARARARRRRPGQEGHHYGQRPGRQPGPRPGRPGLPRPGADRCWVSDFTHIATWAGVVYVAFVVDTFSRRIVGWSAATTNTHRTGLDRTGDGILGARPGGQSAPARTADPSQRQ